MHDLMGGVSWALSRGDGICAVAIVSPVMYGAGIQAAFMSVLWLHRVEIKRDQAK